MPLRLTARCTGVGAAGSLGDVAAFSSCLNKVVTTCKGEMVLTDDADIASASRSLRDQAFEPSARFHHRRLGSIYRMTNLQPALGVARARLIDEIIARKREIAALGPTGKHRRDSTASRSAMGHFRALDVRGADRRSIPTLPR
jgi:hypothetical protein